MKLAAAFLVTLTAMAQGVQEAPEIRGTVFELGPGTGIAGATVTLTERVSQEPDIPVRVIGSVVTDARGQFSFKPGHYGDFYIEASMTGYPVLKGMPQDASVRVTAMSDEPRVIILTLVRPGTLTGRLIDADGNPIPSFRVVADFPDRVAMSGKIITTNQDGVFRFTGLIPGAYLVRTIPSASGSLAVSESFTSADAEVVGG
jgi:hypothetical protein